MVTLVTYRLMLLGRPGTFVETYLGLPLATSMLLLTWTLTLWHLGGTSRLLLWKHRLGLTAKTTLGLTPVFRHDLQWVRV